MVLSVSSCQGRSSSASSFHASLLQAIDGVTSLDLGPQAVSQAPQHFRSSEEQATCDSCFARQCIRSVISLHSGMSRAVQPQDFSKVDVDHRHVPVWAFGSTFDIIIITDKVFTKHEILSLETIQSARMHARRHARTHAHTHTPHLDPTFGIHSHKTLDTSQPSHLLKPN